MLLSYCVKTALVTSPAYPDSAKIPPLGGMFFTKEPRNCEGIHSAERDHCMVTSNSAAPVINGT